MDNTLYILGFDDQQFDRDTYINALAQFKIGGRPIKVDCLATYCDAKKAIEQRRDDRYRPTAVILDIRASEGPTLPDGTEAGFSLCQQIRAKPNWERVPIIFISSGDEYLNGIYSDQFMGVDFVKKSEQTVNILLHKIGSHLFFQGQLKEINIGVLKVNLQRMTLTVFDRSLAVSERLHRLITALATLYPEGLTEEDIRTDYHIADPADGVYKINMAVKKQVGQSYALIHKPHLTKPYVINDKIP